MAEILSESLLLAAVLGAIAAAIPLLLATLGESVGEASGVLNLGIEGQMLFGAYVGFVVAYATQHVWLGMLAACAVGLLSALPMLLALVLNLNQIVVGLAVYLGGLGITSVMHELWLSESNPRIAPGFDWIGVAAVLLVIAVQLIMSRTRWGLLVQATGYNPKSVEVAGASVLGIRALSVIFGSVCSALAGAYLSIQVVGTFTPGMTHGLGFLAIIVTVLARTKIWTGALLSLAFGMIVALGTFSQLTELSVPSDVISIIPFVLVMIVLGFTRKRQLDNRVLGVNYER